MEAAPLRASPCTLAWDQTQDSSVSGYCLYYGIKSSTTTNRLDVGMTGLVTLKNLFASSNYFSMWPLITAAALKAPLPP